MPFWAILVLVVVAATGSDATKPKPISISLRAKWEGTPLLLEAGEFLAREDAALYWKFLAAWPHASPDANSSARPASAAPSPSDGDCLDALLRVASSFLAPPLAPLLRLALAMRSLSPALLLHRQLARLSLSQAGLLGPHGAQEGTAEGEQAGWGAGGGDGGERWRVSENPAAPKGHCCWVELQGKVLLGEAEVAAALAPVQAEESILISVTPPRITSLNRALPSRSCCTALPSPHRGASAPSAAPAAEHGAAVHAFDHVYPSASAAAASHHAPPPAFLYASPGSACFAALLPLLSAAAHQGAIRLVLRPVLPAGCEQHVERCAAVGAGGRVSLGGYGVELALKNMEYKALDDSKLHKDGAGQAAAEGLADDLAQPVKGFLFHTLVQRYPEQTGELLTFRDQLLAAEEIRDEYNVWELKDLGIQATQRIVGGAEPLRLMQDINQNFPKIMASLAKTKARAARSPFPPCADDKGLQYIVDSTVEEAVQEMHGMVQAGRTIVALNSIAFNLATLDIFTLLEAVQAELSLGAQLLSLKVSRPFSHCLLCQLYAAALAISRWPRPASPPPSTSLLPRFLLSPTITPPVSLAIPISSCPVSPCTPLATHQLPAPVVRQLLHLPPASAAREEGGSPRLDFRSPWHVHFFNDLERDREYRGWSPNMHELLMPMYPGQFRPIRKNIFHAVFVLDPMHPSTPKAVAHIHKLHQGSMPLRMGVILASSARLLTLNDPSAPPPHHDLSELAMALFLHIKDSVGVRPAFDFLLSMWGGSGADESVDDYEDAMVTLPLPQYTPPDQPTMEAAFLHTLSAAAAVSQGGSLGSDDARRAALASVLAARQRVEGGDADSEEGGGEQGGAGGGGAAAAVWAQVVGSSRFVSGLGLADAMPCLLFNGVFYPSPKVPGGALEAMQEEMEAVQRAVYYQQIRGSSDVLAFFLASAAKRFNPEVALPAGKTAPYVSLAPPMAADNPALTRLSFLHSPGTEDEVKPFSHLLALDLSSHQGVDLLLQAVLHLESEEGTHARVAVLHNPLHAPATADARLPPLAWRHLVPRLIMAAVQMPSRRSKLPAFLRSLLQLPLLRTVVSRTHSGTEEEGWAGRGEVRSEKEGLELLASAWSIADEAGLNRAELERAVTGAGAAEAAAAHMAQLLAPQHRFVAADFALLEEVESKRVKPALSVLQDLPSWPHLPPDLPLSDHVSGMAMVVASALSSAERASGDYVQFARLTASPRCSSPRPPHCQPQVLLSSPASLPAPGAPLLARLTASPRCSSPRPPHCQPQVLLSSPASLPAPGAPLLARLTASPRCSSPRPPHCQPQVLLSSPASLPAPGAPLLARLTASPRCSSPRPPHCQPQVLLSSPASLPAPASKPLSLLPYLAPPAPFPCFLASIGIIHSNDSALLHIDGVIDPLSAEAQQVTPLLLLLHEWFNPSLRIFMNPLVRAPPACPLLHLLLSSSCLVLCCMPCIFSDAISVLSPPSPLRPSHSVHDRQTSISEFPLKNFYRYAAPHKARSLAPSSSALRPVPFLEVPSSARVLSELADASGVLAAGAEVEFLNMPLTRTLTLNLKVPEPWLVEPAVADHDLDNLVLEKVADPSVAAVFELEALMITGGSVLMGGARCSWGGCGGICGHTHARRCLGADGRKCGPTTLCSYLFAPTTLPPSLHHATTPSLPPGHCYEDSDMQEPPRGMQLVLGTPPPVPSALLNHSSAPATAAATSSNGAAGRPQGLVVSTALEDTIVMANLGYFQLKAAPGLWLLQLAPGRSQTLYQLAGEGALGGSGGGGAEAGRGGEKEGDEGMGAVGRVAMEVAVMDLRGKVVQLRVVKRAGMEGEKMLDGAGGEDGDDEQQAEPAAAASLFGSFFQKLTGKVGMRPGQKPAAKGEGAAANSTINIFSIASGHLYERFTRIMILSVLKNTRRPVKFWFIKNYLSPSFKEVIPHMAREYGFEYGLITYKWPSWLHKQTEKQRLIWAYKILFLDVIFPLSLQKVIFVDADQVVREDMGRLYDMPLHGHPLAYTPMCDNNRDMEGYRFWKQGFWRDHLRGKPYHISALYVVDLVRFRRMAAGDTLRVIYESLSKDPNSLANLDQVPPPPPLTHTRCCFPHLSPAPGTASPTSHLHQDLPNYAQHTVPILSLPQEWLWCESWCGNATKARAKTIDLCNNPMTKEPKLQGARRIVAEWGALDEEQRHFTERVTRGEFDDLPPSAPRGTLRFTGFHSAPRPEEGPVREAMTEEEEGGVDDMDGVSEGEQEREEGEEGGEEGGEGGEEAGDWAGYEVDTAYEDLEGLEEIAVEAVDGVEEGEEGGEEEDEEELGHEEL
ncbi:unnamed protein product [Closterium sp. NIES-65]|nr:unnamed protein product [Closterium sp. NIES-65]